jgi:REP element-mobilizing transposase RayT
MLGTPIRLTGEQARVVFDQFRKTADFRNWQVLAVAIMANHVHLVVGVNGDPSPEKVLHSFKSYGSRALNERWTKPSNGTWWVESGSKRKLSTLESICGAVAYVRDQEYPLLVWLSAEAEAM